MIYKNMDKNRWLDVVMWFVIKIKVGNWKINGCKIFMWFILEWNIG
jgi:hypothetical protein